MKIDRYTGYTFDGEGKLTDHQRCKEVITFHFPMTDKKISQELLNICLDYLNKEENDTIIIKKLKDTIKKLQKEEKNLQNIIDMWRETINNKTTEIHKLEKENQLLKAELKELKEEQEE